MNWIRLANGNDLVFDAPDLSGLTIRDVAHHLSRLNRFTGATAMPLSVAQHSVAVARQLAHLKQSRETQLVGLLHDAHEMIIGDISTPMKRWLAQNDGADFITRLADRIDAQIFHRFAGLKNPVPPLMREAIHLADAQVLAAEWRDLMPGPCPVPVQPAPAPTKPLPWHRAEELFLTTYADLDLRSGASTRVPTDIFK